MFLIAFAVVIFENRTHIIGSRGIRNYLIYNGVIAASELVILAFTVVAIVKRRFLSKKGIRMSCIIGVLILWLMIFESLPNVKGVLEMANGETKTVVLNECEFSAFTSKSYVGKYAHHFNGIQLEGYKVITGALSSDQEELGKDYYGFLVGENDRREYNYLVGKTAEIEYYETSGIIKNIEVLD